MLPLADRLRAHQIDASRAAASTATMFRDMQLDTHPKAPTEDFGPSRKVQSALATKKAMNATKAAARQAAAAQAAAAAAASRKHGGLTAEEKQKLMGSVFGSTGEQRYIAGLANKHRELMQQSEWALLDTLYVQMANEEEVMRARLKANSQAEVRGMLARQLEERAAVR